MMDIVMHFIALLIVASVGVFGAALGEMVKGRFHNGKSALALVASVVSFCLSLWWSVALTDRVGSFDGLKNAYTATSEGQ